MSQYCCRGGGVNPQINISPESRCSPYSRADYSYPQSIELRIIAENLEGKIASPYTGEVFSSRSQTDIEHMVATSEAHDSGLCAASAATRRQFARDLDNLTLASPSVNRYQKSDKDLADWLPPENTCWFVQTVVSVKAKYGLSMDFQEAFRALRILTEDCLPRAECQLPSPVDALNCYADRAPAGSGLADAPTTAKACYTDDSAYVNGTINVRSGAGVNFAKVDVIQSATVSVLGSARKTDYCWLKIGANRWIARLPHVLARQPAAVPRTAASQPVGQPPSQPVVQPTAPPQSVSQPVAQQPTQPAVLSFRTCTEAKNAGYRNFPTGSIVITSPRSQRGDRDGNGIACEG